MKGPMTTQTLQDIIGLEPFHHRGDKDGIEGFAGAYVSLQGDDAPLPPTEMQEFEDFLATITYPPNPFREFDNSLPTNLPLPGFFSTGRYALASGDPLPNGNARDGLTLFTQTGSGSTRFRRRMIAPPFASTRDSMTSLLRLLLPSFLRRRFACASSTVAIALLSTTPRAAAFSTRSDLSSPSSSASLYALIFAIRP